MTSSNKNVVIMTSNSSECTTFDASINTDSFIPDSFTSDDDVTFIKQPLKSNVGISDLCAQPSSLSASNEDETECEPPSTP